MRIKSPPIIYVRFDGITYEYFLKNEEGKVHHFLLPESTHEVLKAEQKKAEEDFLQKQSAAQPHLKVL